MSKGPKPRRATLDSNSENFDAPQSGRTRPPTRSSRARSEPTRGRGAGDAGGAKCEGLLLLFGDGGRGCAEAGDARGVRGGRRRGRVGHVPPRRHVCCCCCCRSPSLGEISADRDCRDVVRLVDGGGGGGEGGREGEERGVGGGGARAYMGARVRPRGSE